ncbi:MAG: hypothetical protein KBB79_03715 [Candidatus Omnitrophica bacterium]|nr:hypothetical protein [Candidatus Omnitrophota bacterium]
MKAIKFMLRTALIFGIILFAASYILKDDLPPKDMILKELLRKPVQSETDAGEFEKKMGEHTYTIRPKYGYELYGLVVSYHHSSVFWDMEHKEWQDYLNNKDIGVIWGDNINTGVYRDMKFTSGSWTLYWDVKFGTMPSKRQDVYSNFNASSISNNHVLAANDKIAALIMSAEKGDQIWMKGYLVDYTTSNWQGFWRESSVTRDDTGSHACEVVYVTDFKILRKADQGWDTAYGMSKLLMLSSLVLYIIAFSIEAFMTGR